MFPEGQSYLFHPRGVIQTHPSVEKIVDAFAKKPTELDLDVVYAQLDGMRGAAQEDLLWFMESYVRFAGYIHGERDDEAAAYFILDAVADRLESDLRGLTTKMDTALAEYRRQHADQKVAAFAGSKLKLKARSVDAIAQGKEKLSVKDFLNPGRGGGPRRR